VPIRGGSGIILPFFKTKIMSEQKKTPNISAVTKAAQAVQPVALPSLAELYSQDNVPVLHKAALFQVLVNQPPKPEWIKEHPITREPYIPIERIEWLLINVVVRYKIEILDVKQIANSVTITIRLHYFDHVFNEWMYHDGVGAAPLQTDKDAGAVNWDRIKSNAVQIGAPAAKSYAVKDAAEQIGKLFGKDLNRKEIMSFENLKDKFKSFTDAGTTDNK
jgi:hypothetical protein